MAEDELPSACLACGDCKALCPQDIDIPDIMEKFVEAIENLPRLGPPPKPADAAK
jgi:hypothetical protein